MKSLEQVKKQYTNAILKQYNSATKRGENGGNGALTKAEQKGVAYYTDALARIEALEAQ